VWRRGEQCHRVDDRPGESFSSRGVVARPVLVQERLQGWRCRGWLSGRRPRASSRVSSTGVRTRHSVKHGDVPSPCAPTASGASPQCPAWRCSDGDGRTGLTAKEKTAPASQMSRRSPVWSRERHSMVLSAPLRGLGALAVQKYAAQCHGADTGLTTQCYIVVGMAFPRESVEQRRGVIPRRVRVVVRSCGVRASNAHAREQERGRRALESPRARRTSPEGASSPRARRTPPKGVFSPRARRTPPEGAFSPRARRTPPEGAFRCAVLAGRGGNQGRDRVVCVF
jgi:hypothetical protein